MKQSAMFAVALAVAASVLASGQDARSSAHGEFSYVFVASGAPELAGWMQERLAPAVREWYPKLVEMFPSPGWRPYARLVFRFTDENDVPAYASGPRVSLGRRWISENPDDVGCAIHELFHVVQGGYRDTPDWLTEGLADYVRFYLYEPGAGGCAHVGKDIAKRHYNDSYRTSAHFLNFVETRFPGTVKELNALCRSGKYDEATYWKKRTGRTVKELEAEWKGRYGKSRKKRLQKR